MDETEDLNTAKAHPEVWVMRQALIDLTKTIKTLQNEVEDLKKQSATANERRFKLGLGIAAVLGVGFLVLHGSLDSLPYN